MLRDHVEPGVRVQMARDIFICLLGFCLVTTALFFLRRLPSCSHPVNTYQVNIKTRGVMTLFLKYMFQVDVLDGASEKSVKRKSKKTLNKETKLKMPETFTSPTNDAIMLFDKSNKEPENMPEKVAEKWMNCYVPFDELK